MRTRKKMLFCNVGYMLLFFFYFFFFFTLALSHTSIHTYIQTHTHNHPPTYPPHTHTHTHTHAFTYRHACKHHVTKRNGKTTWQEGNFREKGRLACFIFTFLSETFFLSPCSNFISVPFGVQPRCTPLHPLHPSAPEDIDVTRTEFSSDPKPCKEIIQTPKPLQLA